MAKRQRNDYGSFEFDSDLDMDFDFDVPQNKSKNRNKPIDHLTDGVQSAMRSKFTDPYHIRSMIRKALPEGFSQAWESADNMVEDSRQLYDEATKELKPHLAGISRKLDALTPESMSRTKKLLQTIKDKMTPEIPAGYEMMQQDVQEMGLQRMFAELEMQKLQVDQANRKSDQAREILNEKVAGKRFDSQQKLLGVIANSAVSTQKFLTGFNVGYQKKSLELQYRTYAATASMAKAFGDFVQRSAKFQDALLVNTSLPEYAKTSNTQRWKQLSKEQFFGGINDRLFKGNSRIAAAGARLRKAGKQKIADYRDAMSMIEDSLEMAIDARDMDKDFAEMEGRESSGWRTTGTFLGDMGGEFLSDWISGKVKNYASKNKGIMRRSYAAGKYAINPGAAFDALKNSKWFKGLGSDGSESGELMRDAIGGLMRLLADASPDMTIKSTAIGSAGEDKMNTQFRIARSQIDVMPGYLARILREITMLRTGDKKVGLLTYDYKSNSFKTESTMSADLMKSLARQASISRTDKDTYAETIESTYKSFVGDEQLSKGDGQQVRMFLAKLARSTDDFNIEGGRLKQTKEFKALTPEMQQLVGGILDKRYTGNDHDATGRQFFLAKGLSESKRSIGNLMGPIQEMIKEGQASLLEKNGVIKKNKDGDWDVNPDAYYKFFDDTIGTSDVNAKTNIRQSKIDGKKALNGFKGLNNYSYNYKGGKGLPEGLAMGPMAQDVRSRFGAGAAPNGKSIDFLNLSGYQTAAIKQMTEMMESMGAGEGINYLRDISETLHRMENSGGGLGGGGGLAAGGATDMFGHFSALVEGGARRAGRMIRRGFTQGAKMTQAAGQGLNKAVNSKQFKSAQAAAISAAMFSATKAVEYGSKLLFETIPTTARQGKELLGKAKDGLINLLSKAKDVYVAGRESPALEAALIRAGYYKDQATGKVIRTMKDVLAAKGNIVDPMNEVRLSLEDKARGIFDGAGEKIKSLGAKVGEAAMGLGAMAFQKAGNALGRAIPVGREMLNKLGRLGQGAGNLLGKIPGFRFGMDPRLLGVAIQIRDLIALDKSGPAVMEILSRDLEKDPPAGVLSAASIKAMTKGLVGGLKDFFTGGSGGGGGFIGPMPPSAGNPGFVGPMPGGAGMGGIIGGLGGLFSAGKQAAGNLYSAGSGYLANKHPGLGQRVSNSRIGKWWNNRKNQGANSGGFVGPTQPGRLSRLGSFAGRGLNQLGNLASMGLGAFGSMASLFGGGPGESQLGNQQRRDEDASNDYSAGSHANRLMQLMSDKVSKGYRRIKGMFGDTDGDGERDGGAGDRMADMAAQKMANEERKQAGIEAAKKGSEAKAMRNSPADNAIEKMIEVATKGITAMAGAAGGLLQTAGDAVGTAADIGDLVGDEKGRGGRRRGRLGRLGKGIGQGASKTVGALRWVGNGIKGIAGRLPGAATVARVGAGAVRAAQVVGLMGGSLGALGGTVVSGIGAALSSPVVLGAAAVGAVGYGAYKLYKYVTRNNIDDYQRIRILQYGLDGTDVTKAYNSKVLALENYLLDGKLAFSGGTASINGRATDPDAIRELFDIATDDAETGNKFRVWYEQRFRPVFLHHVNALYRVDKKASLKDIEKVEPPLLLEYLGACDVSGVWDKTTSPFKGLDALGNNPEPARKLIEAKTKEVSKKVNNKAKEAVKAGDIAPKGDAAKAATEKITAAVPALAATTGSTTLPPSPNPAIPRNSRLGQSMASGALTQPGVSEDGPGSDKGGGQASTTMKFAGTGNLKLASGPMADGSQGMQYVKLGKDANIEGLNPAMKKNFLAMAQEYGQQTGKSILVNEGFRSYARQEQLWRQNPGKAARPGGSMHEFGLALDINTGIMNELEKMGLLRKYGFTRPVTGETWHMEPSGVQMDIRKAKADPQWAAKMVAESAGRGGGGAGSTPNQKKGGRDPALARSIFESTGGTEVSSTASPTSPAGAGAVAMTSGASGRSGAMVSMSGTGGAGIPSSPGPAAMGRGEGIKSSGGADYSGSLGGDKSEIKSQIAKHALEAGADPNEMMLMAAMESGLDPNARAKSSSAKGLNQFVDGTWNEQMKKHGAKYGLEGANPNDPRASTILAAEYMKSNNQRLLKAKGSPLDMTDKYMGHMFGAGGASALMRADANASAASILPSAAKSNPAIFFDGGRPRTVGEVRQLLESRLKKKASEFGIQFPGSGSPAYNVQGTPESSIPQGTVPYKPTAGKVNPMGASPTGYDLPGSSPMMFASKPDGATKAQGVGFEAPVNRAPSVANFGGAMGASRDTSVQVTGELFDRLQTSATEQIKHLSAINESTAKMVDLLEAIVDNTSKNGEVSGSSSKENPGKSIPPVNPAPSAKRLASSSSFDNRRMIAAA